MLAKSDDSTIAKAKKNRPIKKPKTANNILKIISHANPSGLQLNMMPGNLTERVAHQTNTSAIYDPVIMQ